MYTGLYGNNFCYYSISVCYTALGTGNRCQLIALTLNWDFSASALRQLPTSSSSCPSLRHPGPHAHPAGSPSSGPTRRCRQPPAAPCRSSAPGATRSGPVRRGRTAPAGPGPRRATRGRRALQGATAPPHRRPPRGRGSARPRLGGTAAWLSLPGGRRGGGGERNCSSSSPPSRPPRGGSRRRASASGSRR